MHICDKQMKINIIKNLVSQEMNLIDNLISDKLKSPIELILNISKYIMQCKGKRIRPLILLLSAKSCGYKNYKHIELGVIIEFIHTATLLHDDVRHWYADANRRDKVPPDFIGTHCIRSQELSRSHTAQPFHIIAHTTQ